MTPDRHPLLALRPAERRVLLRHLIERESQFRAGIAARRWRHLWLALTWHGTLFLSVFAALFPLQLAPHLLAIATLVVGGSLLAIQSGLGWLLGRWGAGRNGILIRFLALPGVPWRALRGQLGPQNVSASHFVLVAGLLLSTRPQLSRTLAQRLVGRVAGESSVKRAIDWLMAAGYLAPSHVSDSLLSLTLEGRRLLQALNVPLEVSRVPIEMAMPVHLLPLLESPDELVPPEEVSEGARRTGSVFGERQTTLALAQIPRKPQTLSRRWLWVLIALAALLGGVWAAWKAGVFTPTQAESPGATTFHTRRLPHSRGRALQLNPQGLMISAFSGQLYLSLPERFDYKEPITFSGYDMAAECALVHPRVQRAVLAPLGRFLWVESLAQAGGSESERCLVDIETRTVSHRLDARAHWPRDAHVLGWLNAHTLLLATPSDAGRGPAAWMAWNVLDARIRTIKLPAADWFVPLESQAGLTSLAELNHRPDSGWNLRLWHWRASGRFEPSSTNHSSLASAVTKGWQPVRGAVTGDGTRVLLAWKNPRVRMNQNLLTMIPRATLSPVLVPVQPAFYSDAPIFWEEDGPPGQYRFYYHTRDEQGVEPWVAAVFTHSNEPAGSRPQGGPWTLAAGAWRRLREVARL